MSVGTTTIPRNNMISDDSDDETQPTLSAPMETQSTQQVVLSAPREIQPILPAPMESDSDSAYSANSGDWGEEDEDLARNGEKHAQHTVLENFAAKHIRETNLTGAKSIVIWFELTKRNLTMGEYSHWEGFTVENGVLVGSMQAAQPSYSDTNKDDV